MVARAFHAVFEDVPERFRKPPGVAPNFDPFRRVDPQGDVMQLHGDLERTERGVDKASHVDPFALENHDARVQPGPVSYTHLTLPTIA